MKNIVFFIQNFSRPAGSERVTSIIANELVKRDDNVQIISICGDNSCFYDIDSRVQLYTLINCESVDNKKSFLKVLHRLNKFYKNNKVDVCIDIFPALSIYTLLLKKRYHLKNITWEHFNYKVNTGMNRIGRKLAVRFSNQIITLTDKDKNYYIEDNPKHKAKINYILNPSPYQTAVYIPMECREKIIMSVGRLSHEKGFDRLLNVWNKIDCKNNWKLYILGNGEKRESLQQLIERKKVEHVELLGVVKNVDDYYKRASLYVSTSRSEGLPMTMIEAQSFGVPIVSFDYDTGPSEIVTDGTDGYLISGPSEEEIQNKMAEKIKTTLEDDELRVELSKNAYKQSKRFKIDRIMERWIGVLNEI